MAKKSFFKWSKEDYITLQNAVRNYNKKLKILNEYKLVNYSLPEQKSYQDFKKEIFTRQQLNETLSSLNAFMKSNALDEIKLSNEASISRWEREEIAKRQPIAIVNIEIQLMEEKRKQEEKVGYKGISNDKIDSLESTLKTLKNYDKKTGQSLRYAIERIKRIGSEDYDYFKAQVFRENFMKVYKEGLSNYENYNKLKWRLDRINNPVDFYDYVSKSEFLMDIFVLYDYKELNSKAKQGKVKEYGFSAYKDNEEAFNKTLVDDFGIKLKN